MKLEVLSTITIETSRYQLVDGKMEQLEDEILEFSFKTRDLALIIFRGGPDQLIVDDKIMKFLNDGSIVFRPQNNEFWMVVKDKNKFYNDCIEAYVKARNFEIGVKDNVV